MKNLKILLPIAIIALLFNSYPLEMLAQKCSERNPAACVCPNPTDTTCLLLPDIVVTEKMLLDPSWRVEIPGELRISVATPNIGYGILEVEASDWFICMGDTIKGISEVPNACSDGTFPRRLIRQNIYKRDGNKMNKVQRWAGSMTYHPTHAHMHVDDWCAFSIRTKVEGQDPKDWPIIAEGRKIGFCLADLEPCDSQPSYCDPTGGVQLPNEGFGEGRYSDCGITKQGISVGFVDIYGYNLPDMDIRIPIGTCNGDYYLVVEADPFNYFLESDETNNITVAPITLTKQAPDLNKLIDVQGTNSFCQGESLVLNSVIEGTYEWSTGSTNRSIEVTEAGTYSLKVTNDCETFTSTSKNITVYNPDFDFPPVDQICQNGLVVLSTENLQENQSIAWFDSEDSNTPLAITPNYKPSPSILDSTQTFYAESTLQITGETFFAPPYDNNFGTGGFNNPALNAGMLFDVLDTCTLESVKVYAGGARERTIELVNKYKEVLYSKTFDVDAGENRLELNFPLVPDTDYTLQAASDPTFYRNNSNVIYPYNIDGLLSITGSTLDRLEENKYFYYFFYNWAIKEPSYTCVSERKAITITRDSCIVATSPNELAAPFHILQNLGNNNDYYAIQFNDALNTPAQLELINLEGKMIQVTPINSQYTLLDNYNLQGGIYILKIYHKGKTYIEKIYIP